LPRLAAACTADDDDPIGAVERRVEVVEDASDVVWDVFEDRGRLQDCKKVEGWLADWGSGEGEGRTWLLRSGPSLFHIWRLSYVPNPAHTVVPVWGDDRGKRRVLCVRLYPVDLNGTVKENTEATGSLMRRRNFGGIGGCRGGGGTSVRC
jgi:hypothetical protein